MMKTVPTPNTPMVLQTAQWVFNPLGYMTTNYKRYGDIFEAKVFFGINKPLIFVQEPNALQFLLTHDTGKEFSAPGDVNRIVEPLLGKQNLIRLDGIQHRNRRQLTMPSLHGEHLHTYGQIIQDVTRNTLEQWPDGTVADIGHIIQTITLRVILQVIFGLRQGDRYAQMEQLLRSRMNIINTPPMAIFAFVPKLRNLMKSWGSVARGIKMAEETDNLLFAEIQERRDNPDRDCTDVLSLLLAAKDETGNGLTNQELRDELMTLLVAGHDTIIPALVWAIYWTHALPQVKQRLLAELDAVPHTDSDQLLQSSYLTAVCNETLRIYPPGMTTFPRQAEIPLEICGYQLEPGQLILGSIYLLHHRDDLYPQPHLFRPERFLERQFSPYEFMPFGGGVRRCIGSALAQYEMKIIIGTILDQIELTLVSQHSPQPRRRGLNLGQPPIQMQKIGERIAHRRSSGSGTTKAVIVDAV
jgi:cytochrome P450 family 110